MKYTIDNYEFSPRLTQKTKGPIPNTLYRYFSINENNVKALEKTSLWVSQPDSFNDLFDGLRQRTIVSPNAVECVKSFLEKHYSKLIFNEQRFQNNQMYRDEMRDYIYQHFVYSAGIVCTTISNENDLMWAHYSNNEGFAIELNHIELPQCFSKPIEMNYLDGEEDIKRFKTSNPRDNIDLSVVSKPDLWKYENEYRLFSDLPNRYFFETQGFFSNKDDYPQVTSRLISVEQSVFKSITLGFNFFVPHSTHEHGVFEFKAKSEALLKQRVIDFSLAKKIPLKLLKLNPTTLKSEAFDVKLTRLDHRTYKVTELKKYL